MLRSWEGSSPRGRAGLGSRLSPAGLSGETGLEEPFVSFPPGTCTPCSCPSHGEGHIPHELLIRGFASHHGLIPTAAALGIPRLWSNHAHGTEPGCPGSPIPAFLPQDCSLARAPLPGGCTASWCPAPYPASTEPAWAVHFPAAAGEQQGLVGPQILPWLLHWGGRGSDGQRKRGAAG